MEQKKMARRQFGIATASLGTLAALPVCSGAEGLVSPDTQSFGELHRKLVDEGLEWLGGKPILSSSGLKKLVDHLHKLGLIDQSESDMLYAIVDQLASAALEAVRKVVLGFLEKIRQAAALMKAILGIC